MKKVLSIVIVALVVAVVAGAAGYFISANNTSTKKAETVKLGFENIGELATQEAYTKEVVSITNDDLKVLNISIPFTGSKLIFSYPVNIKAGINFSDIKPEVDELTKTIKVKMPEVKVQSCEIDTKGYQKWDETKSAFSSVSFEDNNEALTKMRENATQDAINNGLLDKAKSNAETMLKSFFGQAFDLNEYKIEFVYK